MEGTGWGERSLTSAERVEAAAQRTQEASSSDSGERRQGHGWHDTGIELAWGKQDKKYEKGKYYDISSKEAHEYNRKNFGQPGMQYEDLFRERLLLSFSPLSSSIQGWDMLIKGRSVFNSTSHHWVDAVIRHEFWRATGCSAIQT
jgi:hypothetical protein